MMRAYRIRPEAQADLHEAYWWYERQREGLGADFLLCFEESLQSVRRNAELYPQVRKTVRRATIRRFPYGLFYILEDETLIVVGVFHASCDPQCWQSRR